MVASVVLRTLATSQLSTTGSAAAAPPRAQAATVPTPTLSMNLTLVTSDTVAYREANGRTTATLVHSPASLSSGLLRSYTKQGSLYLVPMDAELYLRSGVDAKATPSAVGAKVRALPSVAVRHTLESVHAAGVSVGKSAARTFWQSITGQPAGTRTNLGCPANPSRTGQDNAHSRRRRP
jgi:hypothetical protein